MALRQRCFESTGHICVLILSQSCPPGEFFIGKTNGVVRCPGLM